MAFSPSSTFNLILFVRFAQKQKTPDACTSGVYIQLGGDLLSHGNIPHYHRHYGVSLLSSVWIQVGPPHYRRQNSVDDFTSVFSYSLSFKPKQADSQLSLSIITSIPGESPTVSLYSLLTATHPIPLSCLRSPQKHLSVVWLSLSGN